MKLIEKYVANDGTEFSSAEKCLAHEALCEEIDAVMARLPQMPVADDCNFYNGHGYLQHSEDVFWPVRDELLRIGNRLFPHTWFDQSLADKTRHPSWAGRIIDEVSRPLYKAWHRILCVDKYLREWGQPYFANNPDKVSPEDMVKLN